jgi:riboflavin synthase
MFTGLIRHIGTLTARNQRGSGSSISINAPTEVLSRAENGASIAVMGVCLTVTARDTKCFEAYLSPETLTKTTLGQLPLGVRLNLESALLMGEPLDGHLVSGHVDATTDLLERTEGEGLWRFAMPAGLAQMFAPKCSVAVNGVSLTVVEALSQSFTVALIPQTIATTTFNELRPGSKVNIEVDPIGRYVARHLVLTQVNEKLGEFVKSGWSSQ